MPRLLRTATSISAAALIFSITTLAQAADNPPKPQAKPAQTQHDLSGVWVMDVVAYHNNPGGGSVRPAPMTAWGKEKFDANAGKQGVDDPTYHCDPPGLPRIATGQEPFEIIQIPGRILILYEDAYTRRTIWMDGRSMPKDLDPSYYGYSIGHWEGDTLVVETSGFNDRSWLSGAGHMHSDQMHITERYRRPDRDTLELTMQIDDPVAYTAPWVNKTPKTFKLAPKTGPKAELEELPCIPEDEEAFRQSVREPARKGTGIGEPAPAKDSPAPAK
jgi:hypothetical protein